LPGGASAVAAPPPAARAMPPVRDHPMLAATAERQRGSAAPDIASAIALEFRGPLFSISSAAQLLRLRAGEDPVIEKHAGRILREVERLNRLVAGLLDYGRPRDLVLVPTDPDQ